MSQWAGFGIGGGVCDGCGIREENGREEVRE